MKEHWRGAREVLRLVVSDLAPELATRGVGLKLSDNIDLVGMVALSRLCPDLADGDAVSTQAPVCMPIMWEADELARAVCRDVRAKTGLPVRDTVLSERIASCVGASLRATGELPDDHAVNELTTTLTQWRLDRETFLTEEEFVARAAPRQARVWLQRGAQALAEHPPSRLLLGHDERPPLVTEGSSPRWLQGTDRSVYSRYRNYFDPRAASRVGRAHQHHCAWDRSARGRGQEFEHSIDTSCEPYGLEHPEHARTIEVIVTAATGGLIDPRPRVEFIEWDSRCAAISTTDEEQRDWLHRRAMAHYDTFWRSSDGNALRRDWGWDLSQHLTEIQALLSRRAWQDLVRREREHLRPAALCTVDRIIRLAVQFGVGAMLWAVLRGDVMMPAAPSVARLDATWQLLLRHTPSQEDDGLCEEGLVAHYRGLLDAVDEHTREGYLEVEEFRVEVRGWLTKQAAPAESGWEAS